MKKGTGFLLNNTTGDLLITPRRNALGEITSGLIIGNTTFQNQAVILAANAGELKHAPTVGVGVAAMLLDNDTLGWRLKIRKALENEGMYVKTIEFDNALNPLIDAGYR